MEDVNVQAYSAADVVRHYATAEGLMPPERVLFGKYALPGLEILDIGVGGGRTTPFLAQGAKRYLGVDYSPAMVEACQARFPGHEFACVDATDMHGIADDSFDLTVFSFNGIDSIPTDAGRIAAMREMRRVTRADGHIILSSHNARQLALLPVLEGASLPQKVWRSVRALGKSLAIMRRQLLSEARRNGHGYIADPVHGGLRNHASTPASIAADAAAAGLTIVEHVGAFAPQKVPEMFNNWETYVLRRSA